MGIELRVCFAIKDFPDVENEKLNIRSLLNNQSHLVILYGISIIIFTIVNLRSSHLRLKTFEDILRMVRIGFLAQFFIDGVSGCKNEEVLIALRLVQVIDACSHQTGLSDTRGHSITEGRELKPGFNLALFLAVFRCGCLNNILAVLLIITMRTDGIEVRESLFLWSSQTHCVFDLVYYLRHLLHLAFKIAFFQKVFRNLLDLDVIGQDHIRLYFCSVDQE